METPPLAGHHSGPWPDRPRGAPERARDTHGHRRPSARLVATWLRPSPEDRDGRDGPDDGREDGGRLQECG